MSVIDYLLHLLQIKKRVSADVMRKDKYPSGAYINDRGSFSAYDTVEAYLLSMQNKNLRKENAENGCERSLS